MRPVAQVLVMFCASVLEFLSRQVIVNKTAYPTILVVVPYVGLDELYAFVWHLVDLVYHNVLHILL